MANGMCVIETCMRRGTHELKFARSHERAFPTREAETAATRWERDEVTLICEYHLEMAVEILASMGHVIDVTAKPRPYVSGPSASGDIRRYEKPRIHDNT